MFGGEELLATLQKELGPGVRVTRAPCVGLCDVAPAVEVGHHFIHHADLAKVKSAIGHGHTHPEVPNYVDYDEYVAQGGYQTLGKIRAGDIGVEDVLKVLDDGALRGLGGAGFPTGRKWRSVRGEPGPAPDGGERRRRRARHLQGPVLPQHRPAPLLGGGC